MIRSLLTTIGEIVGVGCIVYGAWQLDPWIGWVALGAGLILLSMLADRNDDYGPVIPDFPEELTAERPVIGEEARE